ncbi:hypothetical protein AMJ85_08795 [candidate division BRC1 bacterium SM23_51]|nr:MAG: hypothetical protein AMJ85_08795 [candidate division BRC1 bacterium SM23_51]
MLPENVTTLVKGWFTKAESDLRNIRLVLPDPDCPFDTVCFHAQQAAEKYLKGLLTFFAIGFPKTHDLEELAALVPDKAGLNLNVEELIELSQLAVVPRYPGFEDEISRDTAERAFKTAQKVKHAVLESLAREGFDLRGTPAA